MNFKVIVVQPKYQINLGYIARVSKNFGIKRLFFVKPRTKIDGKQAIMFAKHGKELLLKAKIYDDFNASIKDCDVVVGTTGIWRKSKANFRRIYALRDAVSRIKKLGNKNVGILIGRDDIGLTKEEIEKCDMVAYINADEKYPVLNISHALGIILYALKSEGFKSAESGKKADVKQLTYLLDAFDKTMEGKKIRNRKAINEIFKRLIASSQPSAQEIHALITALK